jgi:dephospho-CoA kinase
MSEPLPTSAPRPAIIGLVGGIGAGKSTVARILAKLGAVVSDSDTEAKLVLQEPHVRDQLIAKWGPDILDSSGLIDRAKVAQIIFSAPSEKSFLEGIIHPALHARRAQRMAEAAARGVRAFVIDAPLLFEAHVDRECDAIIFVDAPFRDRLKRVMESRHWPEHELARRESTQMPLDEKRQRSGYTVTNSGQEIELERQVRSVLEAILSRHAAGC